MVVYDSCMCMCMIHAIVYDSWMCMIMAVYDSLLCMILLEIIDCQYLCCWMKTINEMKFMVRLFQVHLMCKAYEAYHDKFNESIEVLQRITQSSKFQTLLQVS